MKIENKKKHEKNFKKISLVIKLVLLGIIIIGIPLYIYFGHHEILDYFSDFDKIEKLHQEYRTVSLLIYLGAQVLQIIICIIPGQVLQFATGYFYGIWIGYAISIAGAALGSAAVYYIAKFLGKDALHVLFGERKVVEAIDQMNSRKGLIITFIIFLIPGIPKDICSYAAGISELKLKPYLIVSLLGRTPGMLGSLIIGQQIKRGMYTGAIIIGIAAVVLFLIGLKFRKPVMDLCAKACDRLLNL